MTKYVLDPPRQIGPARVSAISEITVWITHEQTVYGVTGKTPKYILIADANTVMVFDCSGDCVPLGEVQTTCPELLAAFKSAAEEAKD